MYDPKKNKVDVRLAMNTASTAAANLTDVIEYAARSGDDDLCALARAAEKAVGKVLNRGKDLLLTGGGSKCLDRQ